MSQVSRSILQGFFTTGATPDQTQFANLIDSTLNLADDQIGDLIVGKLATAATGTISVTVGSTTLTGTGTNFVSEFAPGALIGIGTQVYTIASVAGATSAVLTTPATVLATDVAATRDVSLLAVQNAGAMSKLVVDGAGNVGIGNTTPGALLDVSGTALLRGASDGTGLSVDASGHVGIGTPKPNFPLEVNGAVFTHGPVSFVDGTSSSGEFWSWLATSGTAQLANSAAPQNPVVSVARTGTLSAASVSSQWFAVTHAQGAHLEWNRFQADGKTQLGDTYLLNQCGNGTGGFVFGEVDHANNVTDRVRINLNGLSILAGGDNLDVVYSLLDFKGTVQGILALVGVAGDRSADAVPGDIVLQAATGKLLLQSGGQKSAICIASNNNVGIGTPTPGALLEVNGTIQSSGAISAVTFNGSGAGLTGIPAAAITGQLSPSQLPPGGSAGPLAGDVTGPLSATVVATVGGMPAATLAQGASAANGATAANTASAIVQRDATGNFNAGGIVFSRGSSRTLSGESEPDNNTDAQPLTVQAGSAFSFGTGNFPPGTAARAGGNLILQAGNGYNESISFGGGADVHLRSGANWISGVKNGGSIFLEIGGPNNTFLPAMCVSSTCSVGIGTNNPGALLEVNGGIKCIGAVDTTSDARHKCNVAPVEGALQDVLRLRGLRYEWKRAEFPAKGFNDRRQLGFLAQEVREILPDVVSEDSEGYLSIGYTSIIPVLVEALKELCAENQAAMKEKDAELAALRKQLAERAAAQAQYERALDARLAALEKR